MSHDEIIHVPVAKPLFFVEILNDDRSHGIIIARLDRFDQALQIYDDLIRDEPTMRVMMRHMSHVYRNYIPRRLHNSLDRSREYPQ